MALLLLVGWLLGGNPDRTTVSTVPCHSVADCWLDESGKPIARPNRFKGKRVPKGDCGRNLLWLRNRLTCEGNVCVAENIGDAC
jgi:hypothetical protein